MILVMKIVKQTLIQSEDHFFLKNTSFEDRNFLTNLHGKITLIISAIAALYNLTDENLATTSKGRTLLAWQLMYKT